MAYSWGVVFLHKHYFIYLCLNKFGWISSKSFTSLKEQAIKLIEDIIMFSLSLSCFQPHLIHELWINGRVNSKQFANTNTQKNCYKIVLFFVFENENRGDIE